MADDTLEIPEAWHQRAVVRASLLASCLLVFLLAWREQGWRWFPALFPPTGVFVVGMSHLGRRVKSLERKDGCLLIRWSSGFLGRAARPRVDRIPVAVATLEWVGRSLWLRNLYPEGAEAFSPGVLVAHGRIAEDALPWLRAQGLAEPVGR